MKLVALLCVLVALATTVVGIGFGSKKVNDVRVNTAQELLGDNSFIPASKPYAQEEEAMKIHIQKIKSAYKDYTSAMWKYQVFKKIICPTQRVSWDFMTKKSELSVLVLVYMTIKEIRDDTKKLGLEIDTGREKLVVPVSKVTLPPAPSMFQRLSATVRCSKSKLPDHDLIFYLLEYKGNRWAPGLEDAHKKIKEEGTEALQEQNTE